MRDQRSTTCPVGAMVPAVKCQRQFPFTRVNRLGTHGRSFWMLILGSTTLVSLLVSLALGDSPDPARAPTGQVTRPGDLLKEAGGLEFRFSYFPSWNQMRVFVLKPPVPGGRSCARSNANASFGKTTAWAESGLSFRRSRHCGSIGRRPGSTAFFGNIIWTGWDFGNRSPARVGPCSRGRCGSSSKRRKSFMWLRAKASGSRRRRTTASAEPLHGQPVPSGERRHSNLNTTAWRNSLSTSAPSARGSTRCVW
jgi:hypothetical protein